MATKMIWVEATEKAGNRVALQDFHPDHPKRAEGDDIGEAFVHKGNSPQQVAKTGAVMRAIGNGMITEVEASAKGKGKSKSGDATGKKDGDEAPPAKS